MKITHCKIKKSTQKKLLEFFVLEVTARSAANLLEINPNSATLFYHKIREVIGTPKEQLKMLRFWCRIQGLSNTVPKIKDN